MGKPPLTDEERRIKDLTRELHEASQEARQALKNLQAELNTLYESEIRTVLQADLDAAAAVIRAGVSAVEDRLAEMEQQMAADVNQIGELGRTVQAGQQEIMARLAGFSSKEESAKTFAAEAAKTARELTRNEVYLQLIAGYVIDELADKSPEFGNMTTAAGRRGGISVRLADEKHPPGLYDENMRPLDIRITPLSVS